MAIALALHSLNAQAHSVELGVAKLSGESELSPMLTAGIDGANTAFKISVAGNHANHIHAYGLGGVQMNDSSYVIGGISAATDRIAAESVHATGAFIEATKAFPDNAHIAYVRGGVSHQRTSSDIVLPTTSITTAPVTSTNSYIDNGVVRVTDTTTSWQEITTGGRFYGERKTSAFAEIAPRITDNAYGIAGVQYHHSNFDGNETLGYAGLAYQGNGWNSRATLDTQKNLHGYVEKYTSDKLAITAGINHAHHARETMAMVGLRYEFDRPKSADTVSSPTTHMRQRMGQIGFHDPRMARPNVRDERYTHVQNHSTTTQTR